jgi:hypothetical protein
MPNYANGKIYAILNDVNDYKYVGSTTANLARRMVEHRSCAKLKAKDTKLYQHMRAIGVSHFNIVLLQNCPCKSKDELLLCENKWQNKKDSIAHGYNKDVAKI